jgi:dephospho-CoA kinase
MRRWVVTGPMGAGKSLATGWLADRGAAVVDGDRLGHEVLTRPEVVSEIVAAFGPEVAPGGQVDRARLGPVVFADSQAMGRLNRITHARISDLAARRLDELAAGGKHELAVLDAAMYFLFPSPPPVELVVAVIADEEVRVGRLVRERGLGREAASRRVAAQRGMARLWSKADVILENNGSREEFLEQVGRLLKTRLDG